LLFPKNLLKNIRDLFRVAPPIENQLKGYLARKILSAKLAQPLEHRLAQFF